MGKLGILLGQQQPIVTEERQPMEMEGITLQRRYSPSF
jgi:hypothetical protein